MAVSMIEGWSGDNYLVLFSGDEAQAASERYGITDLLPGFRILGLRGWDDFIVEDEHGATFPVPTVPCDRSELAHFSVRECTQLIPDDRFTGKVKWYTTPTKFGGDPAAAENITWISLSQHGDAVRWWNTVHRELKRKSG
jgi:hypothetical protein